MNSYIAILIRLVPLMGQRRLFPDGRCRHFGVRDGPSGNSC